MMYKVQCLQLSDAIVEDKWKCKREGGIHMKYREEVEEYILKADEYLKSIIFKMSPLYKEEHGENQNVTVPLFCGLHSTSESILILLLNQAIFEADILLRTVMEGTIKYCYLMTGTEDEKREKYIEYKENLTDIDKITDHKKAVETYGILKEFSRNSTKPIEYSILSDEELSVLLEKYPKEERRKLRQKWSYQSLLRSLVQVNQEYRSQLGTLSTYSLSSHYGHYDWTGLESRNAQIEDSIHPGAVVYDIMHAMRILSNVLSMELLRLTEYMRGNNFHSREVTILYVELYEFIIALDEVNDGLLERNLLTREV